MEKRRRGSIQERFWSKVNKDGPLPAARTLAFERGILSPCWLWTGTPDKKGYGYLQVGTMAKGAHKPAYRISWEIANDKDFPEGLEPDHLCRLPICVNPDHIEPVTHRENMRRIPRIAAQLARTECPQGHLYDEKNTRIKKNGKRDCRACDNDRQKRKRRARNNGHTHEGAQASRS